MPRKNRRIRDEDLARLWDLYPLYAVLPETPAVEPHPAEETVDAA